MSKEKLYGLRDQLSKFLYDPTAKQMVERKKLFDEQRFGEILEQNKQVEKHLEYVEKQIEAFEAAEPSLGKKIVTNTLLNLPLGKGLKGMGLGSLLGIAEEEVGTAEAQRLKGIEQEIYELNAIRQRDLEGGKVTSGTTRKIDADIRALENEGAELKQLLSTPLSEEPEDRKMRLVKEVLEDQKRKGLLNLEKIRMFPEPLAKSLGISTEDLLNTLQQGEKEGIMSMIGKTPTTGERIAHFTLPGNAVKILEEGYDANLPPVHGTAGLQGGPREGKAGGDILYFTTDEGRWSEAIIYVGEGEGNISKDVYDYDKQEWGKDKNAYKKVNLEKVEAVIKENARTLTIDSWEAADAFEINPERHRDEFIGDMVNKAKAEGYDIVNLKNPGDTAWHSPTGKTDKYGEKDWYETLTGASGKDDYFILNKEVVEMVAPEIKDAPKKGYQAGGLIMNYGDYGRSYT